MCVVCRVGMAQEVKNSPSLQTRGRPKAVADHGCQALRKVGEAGWAPLCSRLLRVLAHLILKLVQAVLEPLDNSIRIVKSAGRGTHTHESAHTVFAETPVHMCSPSRSLSFPRETTTMESPVLRPANSQIQIKRPTNCRRTHAIDSCPDPNQHGSIVCHRGGARHRHLPFSTLTLSSAACQISFFNLTMRLAACTWAPA